MSFILDALKKSEAERQRQSGPNLLEIRVLPQDRRWPLWSIAVVAVLCVNVGVLLWLFLRRAPIEAPVVTAPTAAPVAAQPPAHVVPTETPAAANPVAPALNPTPSAASAAAPVSATAPPNPADLEPALPAATDPTLGATRATSDEAARDTRTLPSFAEVGANMPPLRLDLHVYSPRAQDRYSLINMHKAREGDVLPEGPRVIEITADGVVLDYQGQQFILRQE